MGLDFFLPMHGVSEKEFCLLINVCFVPGILGFIIVIVFLIGKVSFFFFFCTKVFYYVFNGLRLYKILFQKHTGCKYFMIINSIKGTIVLNIPVDSL